MIPEAAVEAAKVELAAILDAAYPYTITNGLEKCAEAILAAGYSKPAAPHMLTAQHAALDAVEKLCKDAEEVMTVAPSDYDRLWVNSIRDVVAKAIAEVSAAQPLQGPRG